MTERKERKEILRAGRRGQRVRVVEDVNHGHRVYLVLWRDPAGRRHTAVYARPRERAEALAFADGLVLEQAKPGDAPRPRLTLDQLFTRYQDDKFPELRPRSRLLYRQFWAHFANFAGPHVAAEDVGIETMTGLRRHLERAGKAVNTIRRVFAVVRMVFRWGEMHELMVRNRVALYVYRVAKERRPVSPAEYRSEELGAILATLNPAKATEWRPFVALTLCGNQGARQNAVLHLDWKDIDLDARRVTWRARWDKTGVEWTQPLRAASLAALEVARARTGGRGWVLPGFGRGDVEAPYTIQALWSALKRAEARAGIPHRSRRGGHGFRRLVAGDVAAATGDGMLALSAIGDRDPRQAERYIKAREDRLRDVFDRMDAAPASELQAKRPEGS